MAPTRRQALLLMGVGTLATACDRTASDEPAAPSSSSGSPGASRPSPAQPPTSTVSPSREPTPENREPAVLLTPGSLRDSVGVNVHWSYRDTPYYADYARVEDLLSRSGIRHVRGELDRWEDLRRHDIRTTLLIDLDTHGEGDPVRLVERALAAARAGAIAAFEGPNEGDLFWKRSSWTYRQRAFPEGVKMWQEALYLTVKKRASTSGIPVIGPSLGQTYWGGTNPFRAGELSRWADWGNFHPYTAGNPFFDRFEYAGVKEYYRRSNFPSLTLDRAPVNFTTYRPPFGRQPMAATEMGYSTWNLGESERVQARYTPRIFLEFLRLGIKRTYLYELADAFPDPAGSDRDAHFGLLRHDLSPKPSYFALKSLLEVAGEGVPRSRSALKKIGWDLQISVSPASGYDKEAVHHLFLRTTSGETVIPLWHEVSANDLSPLDHDPPRPVRELSHPAAEVVIRMNGVPTSRSRITVSTIGDDGLLTRRTPRWRGRDLHLSVSDQVSFVVIPGR